MISPDRLMEPSDSTILIVDDSSVVRKSLDKTLRDAGYRTVTASSGEKAIEKLKSAPSDLVILDVHMPRMSGYEVLREIRANPTIAGIPVVMLTAMSDVENRIEAFTEGADDYILKPYDSNELLIRIGRLLNVRVLSGKLSKATEEKNNYYTQLEELLHNYEKRNKELHCLYAISKLVEQRDVSLEELLQNVAGIITPSWQYPEITCARITLKGQVFQTGNFGESIWNQASDIIVHGDRSGSVEVCYLEERPQKDEGPFLKEERGLIDAIAGSLGRIIEHKESEKALRKVANELRTTFDTMPDLVMIIDKDYRITRANKAVSKTMGFPSEEIVGQQCFLCLHDHDAPRGYCTHTMAMADGKQHFNEIFSRNLDKYFLLSTTPLIDDNGNITSSIHVMHDITERRRAKEALQHAEKRQRRAEQLAYVGEIAAKLSHEIKNPLATVDAGLELLESELDLDSENLEVFQSITRDVKQITQLISDLLNKARSEPFHPQPIILVPLVREICESFKNLAKTKNINFIFDFPPSDSDIIITIDESAFEKFLSNLFINAIDAVGKGGMITVRCRELASVEVDKLFPGFGGGVASISVIDNGQGIPSDMFEVIFDPFYTNKVSGTGLGLTVARDIVELHGGKLIASSVPCKETIFEAFMPAGKISQHYEIRKNAKCDVREDPRQWLGFACWAKRMEESRAGDLSFSEECLNCPAFLTSNLDYFYRSDKGED